MTDFWEPPEWLKKKVIDRDKNCVYCGIKLKEYYSGKGKDKATLEHIENRPCVEEWNIAMCCNSCNSSKGTKKLPIWLKSTSFKKKKINMDKFAPIIKEYLKKNRFLE